MTVEYEYDQRPMVFTGGLTNKKRSADNPYGEHPDWRDGVPGTIYNHLNSGLDRTMLRQPVGPGEPGWVVFSSWHPLSNAQKLDFMAGIAQWKSEQPDRRVGVFLGRDCTDPFVRRDVGIDEGPLLPPNQQDPQAMRWWTQNIAPLAAAGVDEIGLDRGAANDSPSTRQAITMMARLMRALYGIKLIVEATPQRFNAYGQPDHTLGPDWEYMRKVPSMALWRYIHAVWIARGLKDLLVVPDHQRGLLECHCCMSAGDKVAPDPTTEDVDFLSDAGWTISYRNAAYQIPDPPEEPTT